MLAIKVTRRLDVRSWPKLNRDSSLVAIRRFNQARSYWDRGRPARTSNAFTQSVVELMNSDNVAFNESGRGARGPSYAVPVKSGLS